MESRNAEDITKQRMIEGHCPMCNDNLKDYYVPGDERKRGFLDAFQIHLPNCVVNDACCRDCERAYGRDVPPHYLEYCPTFSKLCGVCGKPGHLTDKCPLEQDQPSTNSEADTQRDDDLVAQLSTIDLGDDPRQINRDLRKKIRDLGPLARMTCAIADRLKKTVDEIKYLSDTYRSYIDELPSDYDDDAEEDGRGSADDDNVENNDARSG